jgi:hypothetical protein
MVPGLAVSCSERANQSMPSMTVAIDQAWYCYHVTSINNSINTAEFGFSSRSLANRNDLIFLDGNEGFVQNTPRTIHGDCRYVADQNIYHFELLI